MFISCSCGHTKGADQRTTRQQWQSSEAQEHDRPYFRQFLGKAGIQLSIHPPTSNDYSMEVPIRATSFLKKNWSRRITRKDNINQPSPGCWKMMNVSINCRGQDDGREV